MGKRVRISDESLNSYGTRVLTDGMDIEQYRRNPVLLFMHQRGLVIGLVRDIRKENGEVTGELEFDEATPESIRAKKQFEFGSLKMVSAGIDVVELSDDPSMLVQGQTSPTVSKSKLCEVSVVDIGSNDNSLVLSMDGDRLEMAKDGSGPLPKLINKQPKQSKQMDLHDLALKLGLDATADESAVSAKITSLLDAEKDVAALRAEKETMTLSAITRSVEEGIAQKRIPADKKEHFITLGKVAGLESLNETIAAMTPATKVSQLLAKGADGVKTPEKLSDMSEERILQMRKEDREMYSKLYKAEYGFDPSFDED